MQSAPTPDPGSKALVKGRAKYATSTTATMPVLAHLTACRSPDIGGFAVTRHALLPPRPFRRIRTTYSTCSVGTNQTACRRSREWSSRRLTGWPANLNGGRFWVSCSGTSLVYGDAMKICAELAVLRKLSCDRKCEYYSHW